MKTDGTLACWGNNDPARPTPPAGTFTAVSAGAAHTCGLKTKAPSPAGATTATARPTPPAGTFTAVSAGVTTPAAMRTNGTLACWGDNGYGQATPPAGTFTGVSAGDFHTCGVRTDGTLACWGDNGYGQATPPAAPSPASPPALPHLRRQDRRHPRLLGLQRRRPGQRRPAGTFTAVTAGGTTPAP